MHYQEYINKQKKLLDMAAIAWHRKCAMEQMEPHQTEAEWNEHFNQFSYGSNVNNSIGPIIGLSNGDVE